MKLVLHWSQASWVTICEIFKKSFASPSKSTDMKKVKEKRNMGIAKLFAIHGNAKTKSKRKFKLAKRSNQ